MRWLAMILFVGSLLFVVSFTAAQPPGGGKDGKGGPGKGGKGEGKGGPGGPGGGKAVSVEDMVARMMAFDKNMDGKLTRDEVTDARLMSLFERADANKDGIVTKEELTDLFTKESAALGGGGGGGPGGGGPGGPGGPGGGGPGGPGGGPPRPGIVLPPFVQEQLRLTEEQKKQIADMQKQVDAKLDTILTSEQKKRLQEMQNRGPGGPGGPPKMQ